VQSVNCFALLYFGAFLAINMTSHTFVALHHVSGICSAVRPSIHSYAFLPHARAIVWRRDSIRWRGDRCPRACPNPRFGVSGSD
jgi:hypothetical protein